MRIAHLSDLHLLEPAARRGLDVRFVSLGRRLDAADRAHKVARAIEAARQAGAEHFVTLVPGNHDVYDSPHAWARALVGPLRPFAAGAATAAEPDKVVERSGVFLLPVDATFHQPVTRSAGRFTDALAEALARRLADGALQRATAIVITHHPPHRRPGPWHWVDGMLGCERLLDLVAPHANVLVLHGHLHRAVDRLHGLARVAGAEAVVDDDALPRVSIHDVAANERFDLVA